MGVQLLRQDQAIPQHRAMLLQILLPHPPVLAQGLVFLLGQAQVGNPVIPAADVGQVVHFHSSFQTAFHVRTS